MLADLVVLARQQGIDSFDSFKDQFTVWSTEQNAWHRYKALRQGVKALQLWHQGVKALQLC